MPPTFDDYKNAIDQCVQQNCDYSLPDDEFMWCVSDCQRRYLPTVYI